MFFLLAQEVTKTITDVTVNTPAPNATTLVWVAGITAVVGALSVAFNQLLNSWGAYRKRRREEEAEDNKIEKQEKLDDLEIEERRDALEEKRSAAMKKDAFDRIAVLEGITKQLSTDHMDCEKAHARCEERVKGLEEACHERDNRVSMLEIKCNDIDIKYRTLKAQVNQKDSDVKELKPPV